MTVDIFSPESFAQSTISSVDDTSCVAPQTRVAFNKLQKKLRRGMGQAIADYNMIEDGDKVMVCVSGGKDSSILVNIPSKSM